MNGQYIRNFIVRLYNKLIRNNVINKRDIVTYESEMRDHKVSINLKQFYVDDDYLKRMDSNKERFDLFYKDIVAYIEGRPYF